MRVFDCHIHVQPWEQFNPAVRAVMAGGEAAVFRAAEGAEDNEANGRRAGP